MTLTATQPKKIYLRIDEPDTYTIPQYTSSTTWYYTNEMAQTWKTISKIEIDTTITRGSSYQDWQVSFWICNGTVSTWASWIEIFYWWSITTDNNGYWRMVLNWRGNLLVKASSSDVAVTYTTAKLTITPTSYTLTTWTWVVYTYNLSSSEQTTLASVLSNASVKGYMRTIYPTTWPTTFTVTCS